MTDPIATATQVAGLVESQGGRISARSQQAAGERRTAFAVLTARIPADRVSSVLDQLTDYGAVRESQLESTEVTAQVRDLDARIEAMQISVDRLEELLSRSGDLEDIGRVEQVLTDRQASLEQR
ncbi:MAG TPA: DUF4349 domain-containing protein, partial [Actinotalea sp.]|nr:DUF4349 domain-containing protein [Actinotalea sp.]